MITPILILISVLAILYFIVAQLEKIKGYIDEKKELKPDEIESRPSKDKLIRKYGKPKSQNLIHEKFKPKFNSEKIFLETGGKEISDERLLWKVGSKYVVVYLLKGRLCRKFS